MLFRSIGDSIEDLGWALPFQPVASPVTVRGPVYFSAGKTGDQSHVTSHQRLNQPVLICAREKLAHLGI